MKTYTALFDIPEAIIILMGTGGVGWLAWAVRKYKQASEKTGLAQAWSEVLDDPHYTERRRFEERKRVEDDEHKRAASARS